MIFKKGIFTVILCGLYSSDTYVYKLDLLIYKMQCKSLFHRAKMVLTDLCGHLKNPMKKVSFFVKFCVTL